MEAEIQEERDRHFGTNRHTPIAVSHAETVGVEAVNGFSVSDRNAVSRLSVSDGATTDEFSAFGTETVNGLGLDGGDAMP
jgi:hypothetical protein